MTIIEKWTQLLNEMAACREAETWVLNTLTQLEHYQCDPEKKAYEMCDSASWFVWLYNHLSRECSGTEEEAMLEDWISRYAQKIEDIWDGEDWQDLSTEAFRLTDLQLSTSGYLTTTNPPIPYDKIKELFNVE